VQLLLIGYSSIAMFCFQAVYCVEIEGDLYLFIQAEIVQCYQEWQKLIIAFIILLVAIFPISLYVGCRLLRSGLVSSNHFLFIIKFPPSTLYFLVKSLFSENSTRIRPLELEATENILILLNRPFKSTENNPYLIWEAVMILCRLVLVVVTTFVLSPIEKVYPVGLLLVVYMTHDYVIEPFRFKKLNFVHTLVMYVLIVLTLINAFWAYTNEVNLLENPRFYVLGEIFLYFEIFILVFPLIFILLILFFKLSRFLYKCF